VSRLRLLFLVLLVACEEVAAGTSKRARNASKRLGVNKTNSKLRMLDCRPLAKRGHAFVVKNQWKRAASNLSQSVFKEF
jgi:hypothetical protein